MGKEIKIWYDEEGDYLEALFERQAEEISIESKEHIFSARSKTLSMAVFARRFFAEAISRLSKQEIASLRNSEWSGQRQ